MSDQARSDERSFVTAIASLHDAHDRRVARAERVRGARVAAVDAKTASRLAPLVARCGASVVPLFADPDVVVIGDQGLFEDRHALGALRGTIVEESELTAMVEAFEEVYRPRSLQLALHRAKARIAQDHSTSRSEGEPRRLESGRLHSRHRETRAVGPRALTADDRALEEAARRRRDAA